MEEDEEELFFYLYMFLANQRFIIIIFSSFAPHRGRPTAKCHPWWQPTRRIAVSCGLGRRQIRTRDCRTTVWHATIEPPCLPIEPPRLPIEPPRLPIEPPHLPIEPPCLPIEPPRLPIEPPHLAEEELHMDLRPGVGNPGLDSLGGVCWTKGVLVYSVSHPTH